MEIRLSLTAAEAQAVLRAELSNGFGVRRSRALLAAEAKLHDAIKTAKQAQASA